MKVSGIALSTETEYGESAIRDATEGMEGTHIVSGSDNIDDVIGEVTDAEYVEGEGVRYTGEIVDEEISKKIEQEYVDLAPRLILDRDDDGNTTEVQFDRLFATPYPDESVPGVTDRNI